MMAKIDQTKALLRDADQLRSILAALEKSENRLEQEHGREHAQAWARAQLSTLNESQLIAVEWALFDQRRELIGDGDTPDAALKELANAFGGRIEKETARLSKSQKERAKTQTERTDRYRQIARTIVAKGHDRFSSVRDFHRRCDNHPDLEKLSDEQARKYIREARKELEESNGQSN